MRQLFIGFGAIGLWIASILVASHYGALSRVDEFNEVSTKYTGSCVDFPPYELAKVIAYFRTQGWSPKDQLQLVVQRKDGNEDALFVDAEPFLAQDPRPCKS